MTGQGQGRYAARFAWSGADLLAAQRLRARAFRGRDDLADADRFDPLCRHVLVEDRRDGRLACCFRLLPLPEGRRIGDSYSAQHYDLSRLAGFDAPMLEMGRFCTDPDADDPDILRVAWAAITRFVEAQGVAFIFGCTSFQGIDAAAYADVFALLQARHLAPRRWQPEVKAPDVIRFAGLRGAGHVDGRAALTRMPPLLRSYLALGGWVSDHAVVDRDLNTLHVFTGVEVRAIPANRRRHLHRAARQAGRCAL